jgi:hypothetical protein
MTDRFWGLNTFEEIPEGWAEEMAARGWGRVRVEGTNYGPIMAQCQRNDLWPLWILARGQETDCPSGIDVEIGNEDNAGCDKWPQLSSADYAAWVLEAWPVLLAKGCTVYVGAANNMSPSAHAWLREVLARLPVHPQLRVSCHRYPDGDQDVTKPKAGYKSLAAEEAAWLDVVRGRRWAITEAGLVDASGSTGWWFWRKRWTRKAVDGHRTQAARFRKMGADFYVVYQMQDGPPGSREQYGIRTVGGTWKAQADLPSLG